MTRVVPFEIDHLRNMNLPDKQLLVGLDATIEAFQKINGPAYSMEHDGRVVGSAGIMRMWPGLGDAWAIVSEDIFACPVAAHRYTKRIFPQMIKDGKFHRVQAVVLKGFEKGVQWVSNLGFEFEGQAKAYGPNREDYLRFVILR